MERDHVLEDLGRIKIEALRYQGLGSLAELAFLGQCFGAADVAIGGGGGGDMSTTWLARGLAEKVVEASFTEHRDSGLDGGGFLLEVLFSRGEKKHEFRVGEGLEPFLRVVQIGEDVIPDGGFERRQLPPCCLRTVAHDRDASGGNVVEGEGDGGSWRRRWSGSRSQVTVVWRGMGGAARRGGSDGRSVVESGCRCGREKLGW